MDVNFKQEICDLATRTLLLESYTVPEMVKVYYTFWWEGFKFGVACRNVGKKSFDVVCYEFSSGAVAIHTETLGKCKSRPSPTQAAVAMQQVILKSNESKAKGKGLALAAEECINRDKTSLKLWQIVSILSF